TTSPTLRGGVELIPHSARPVLAAGQNRWNCQTSNERPRKQIAGRQITRGRMVRFTVQPCLREFIPYPVPALAQPLPSHLAPPTHARRTASAFDSSSIAPPASQRPDRYSAPSSPA